MKQSREALALAHELLPKIYAQRTTHNAELRLAVALDRAVADERERLRVAVKSMKYDGLWGGQRRIGWELGKDQALEIIGEPS